MFKPPEDVSEKKCSKGNSYFFSVSIVQESCAENFLQQGIIIKVNYQIQLGVDVMQLRLEQTHSIFFLITFTIMTFKITKGDTNSFILW